MGSLLEKTLDLLRNHRQKTLREIEDATELPYYWLRKMASGEIADPGVNRVQKLYEYLSQSTISLS